MSKKPFQTLVSDLNKHQRGHLVWRLDHRTYCGLLTAGHIARGEGEYGAMSLFDVFKLFDMSDHQAKIHSFKVVHYEAKFHHPLQKG